MQENRLGTIYAPGISQRLISYRLKEITSGQIGGYYLYKVIYAFQKNIKFSAWLLIIKGMTRRYQHGIWPSLEYYYTCDKAPTSIWQTYHVHYGDLILRVLDRIVTISFGV